MDHLRVVMSVVRILMGNASMFIKADKDLTDGDYKDLTIDALRLGVKLAESLLPPDVLDRQVHVGTAQTFALHMLKDLTDAWDDDIRTDGHTNIQALLRSLDAGAAAMKHSEPKP